MTLSNERNEARMVWQSIVFIGLIIGIPIVIAAFLGGRSKKGSKRRQKEREEKAA
jgi:hypothetical protein